MFFDLIKSLPCFYFVTSLGVIFILVLEVLVGGPISFTKESAGLYTKNTKNKINK